MKKKPPLPISKKAEILMQRIISESGPTIRGILDAQRHEGLPDFALDKPLEWIREAEFLSGLAIGVGVALKWLEEHESEDYARYEEDAQRKRDAEEGFPED